MGKATGPVYRVPPRRRRKNLTNYKKRLGLIKSKLPRMVVRKSSRNILVQFIEYGVEGDRTLCTTTSKELSKHGWRARCNTPSAYLTGMLAAKKAIQKGVKRAILDIGLQTSSKGSVIFAAARGASSAGVELSVGKEMSLENREKGAHIAEFAKAMKGKPEYDKLFSAYTKASFEPENIASHFEKAEASIRGDSSG